VARLWQILPPATCGHVGPWSSDGAWVVSLGAGHPGVVLVLLRQNLNQTLVADWFGVSQPTVSRTHRRLLPLLEQVTCTHRPPLPEALRGRVVLVYGTLVPIGNRETDRALHEHNHSGKHHQAGLSVQVLADLSGCLLAVSTPVPSRTHDRAAFTTAGLAELLANTPTIGDLGYQGTTAIRPRRKPPGRAQTRANHTWNHSNAQLRVAVERAIAHPKNRKILTTGYRGRLTELPHIIRIVTTLQYHRLGW
jgi:hypothetical protein